MQIPFVGAAYKEASVKLDAQVCINLYPVLGESGTAKAVRALYGTPGLRRIAQVADGVVRGAHAPTDGGACILVIGKFVYRYSAAGSFDVAGFVDDLTTPVKIDDNGFQAVIVTGPNGYTLDLASNVVAQIIDPGFYGADNVDFLNTYAIFNKPGTNQFYISGPNEITFDPLDFATAESNFEPIINHIVNHDQLILFKRTTTEVWRTTANPDFPFARDSNAAIEQGLAARDSVATLDNSVAWLGQDTEGGGMIYQMSGYVPQRISTTAIETAIARYRRMDDAVAFSYQQDGHTFYQISFPSGGQTWVYDVATQMWHQRAYLNPASGNLERHRANCHAYFNDLHIVGDYRNGKVYVLDPDHYFDDQDPLPAIRASSHIFAPDYPEIRHNRLQVDIEAGVGLTTGRGRFPVALLDWSDDGGFRWSNQHSGSMGAKGEYRARLRWNRLGRSRDRIYRLTISDPVKRVILGAALNPTS